MDKSCEVSDSSSELELGSDSSDKSDEESDEDESLDGPSEESPG